MHILLTNDDGLMAPGLLAAYEALKERGHQVTVCAPESQRSASSNSVTLYQPVKVAPWVLPDGELGFAVYGTPADCSRLGFSVLAKEPVDLVVSGINDDFNLGYDVNYSGTVAAAMEAASAGYPALAVSLERSPSHDWKLATHILLAVIDNFAVWKLPPGVAVNLNIPAELSTGRNDWFWAPLYPTPAEDFFEGHPHPDGSVVYQRLRTPIELESDEDGNKPMTDLEHAQAGHVTLSPIVAHSWHEPSLARLIGENKQVKK